MSIPDEYFKAGSIASEIRAEIRRMVHVGSRLLDICSGVEDMIRDRGGEPAFPCNVCVNSVAAHYTSMKDDTSVVEDGDLVKVDFGVHVNGYLVDTAMTISFNPLRICLNPL